MAYVVRRFKRLGCPPAVRSVSTLCTVCLTRPPVGATPATYALGGGHHTHDGTLNVRVAWLAILTGHRAVDEIQIAVAAPLVHVNILAAVPALFTFQRHPYGAVVSRWLPVVAIRSRWQSVALPSVFLADDFGHVTTALYTDLRLLKHPSSPSRRRAHADAFAASWLRVYLVVAG